MTKPPRSEAERHAQAKQAVPKLERERDVLTAQWRQGLVNDDESAVERCERQLNVVERKLRRSQALIDLLPPLVQRERQQQAQKTSPTSREQARAMLAALEPWLVANESIPLNDRHAGHDRDRDEMRQRKYYLTGLLRTLPEEAALSKGSAA